MSGFTSVATSYAGTQAGLIIALLESCGIDVLMRDFHTAVTLSNYTHAIGGIDISVPDADAREAIDIISASQIDAPCNIKPWVIPFLIVGTLWAGAPPPGTGVILNRDQNELVFG